MRRSDRQRALIDHLRARAETPVPVPRLAERYGVSTRTVERDIRALQESGIPIYGSPGRGGGYAIGRDFSLPPLALTQEEALAVLAGLGVMAGSPFARGAERARDKVLAAMGARARAEGHRLSSRVDALAPEARTADDVERVVREVLLAPRVVELVYRDHRTDAETERAVEPLGLILVRGAWVLVGWCRLRDGVRGFRTDRIVSITPTTEPLPRREGDPLRDDLARWDFLGPVG